MSKELLALLDQLEERYPNSLPDKVSDDLLRLIGQQDVIKFISSYIEQSSRVKK